MTCVDKDIQTLKVKSETEFQKVENWIKTNKLTLNYKKSNYVLFTNNKTKTSNNFS